MSYQSVSDLLEEDRAWLEKQPGMNPWPEGVAMAIRHLQSWSEEYAPQLGVASLVQQPDNLLQRLWICWRHHWQQAVEMAADGRADGQEVAQRIRTGQGYRRGQQLGGDSLRDVVLAEAVLARDPAATACFEEEYKSFCIKQGRKVNPQVDQDPDDFWCGLLDRLAGYSSPPGKLAQFVGRCGLRNWLGRTANNFACDYPPQLTSSGSEVEDVIGPTPPDESPETDECLKLLAQFVRQALDDLPSEDRLVLYLVHVDQLPGKEVAKVFGIAAGNVSRRKEKATDRLRVAMEGHATASERQCGYRDCLELLTQHRNWQRFGELLASELTRAGQEAHQPEEVRP